MPRRKGKAIVGHDYFYNRAQMVQTLAMQDEEEKASPLRSRPSRRKSQRRMETLNLGKKNACMSPSKMNSLSSGPSMQSFREGNGGVRTSRVISWA